MIEISRLPIPAYTPAIIHLCQIIVIAVRYSSILTYTTRTNEKKKISFDFSNLLLCPA